MFVDANATIEVRSLFLYTTTIPFESFHSFFNKRENQEVEKEQAAESTPEVKPLDLSFVGPQSRSMEELSKQLHESLERQRRESEELNRSIHEDLVKRAPEILKQKSNALLPSITKTLRRAFSYASEEDWAREHIRVPEGELASWRYYDLEEPLLEIDAWREYLSQEALDGIRQQVSAQSKTALQIVEEYRTWGAQHEPRTETQRNTFDSLWTLHVLAPDVFTRDLVTLSDTEFKEIGTVEGSIVNSSTKLLAVHAKLAEYDPERFRAIFGAAYTPEKLNNMRKRCERRDWQEPLKVPMWSPLLRIIEGCIAASDTNPAYTR